MAAVWEVLASRVIVINQLIVSEFQAERLLAMGKMEVILYAFVYRERKIIRVLVRDIRGILHDLESAKHGHRQRMFLPDVGRS